MEGVGAYGEIEQEEEAESRTQFRLVIQTLLPPPRTGSLAEVIFR